MSSTNHTTNYALPQWEATDEFRREDFNDAFARIDTAVKANADAVEQKADSSTVSTQITALQNALLKTTTGSWTGDGGATRTINIGFTPKFVLIFGSCYSGSERD